jgi:hypothetical protein
VWRRRRSLFTTGQVSQGVRHINRHDLGRCRAIS